MLTFAPGAADPNELDLWSQQSREKAEFLLGKWFPFSVLKPAFRRIMPIELACPSGDFSRVYGLLMEKILCSWDS